MSLNVGSRPGHYDVTALIDEGGDGPGLQATDMKLNLQVALKILPEAFAADPDRLPASSAKPKSSRRRTIRTSGISRSATSGR